MLDFATNCTDTWDIYRFLKRQSYLEISKQGQLRIWIALTNRFAKQAHFFIASQARYSLDTFWTCERSTDLKTKSFPYSAGWIWLICIRSSSCSNHPTIFWIIQNKMMCRFLAPVFSQGMSCWRCISFPQAEGPNIQWLYGTCILKFSKSWVITIHQLHNLFRSHYVVMYVLVYQFYYV